MSASRVVVLITDSFRPEGTSTLHSYDASTWAPGPVIHLPMTFAMTITAKDEVALALADGSVVWANLDSALMSQPVFVADAGNGPFDIVTDSMTGETLVANDETQVAGVIDSSRRSARVSAWFEFGLSNTVLSDWPAGTHQHLAFLVRKVGWRSFVALYDTKGARLLPGSVPLGHGPVSAATLDGHGRVIALLPWSGELIRIAASPPE